jgi:hypothetical protein
MQRLAPLAAAALALPALVQAQEDAIGEGRTGPVDTRDSEFLQVVEGIEVLNAEGTVVGEIGQVLIDDMGRPAGFILEIDGFLGILDRDVQVPMESLVWEESHYVTKMTETQLENLAPWDE